MAWVAIKRFQFSTTHDSSLFPGISKCDDELPVGDWFSGGLLFGRARTELRSEAAYSREEGKGLWVEGAYRFRSFPSPELSRLQVVARTQVFRLGTLPGLNPDLPSTDMQRTEFGVNYYLTDGWKGLASYGRTFTSAGDSNLWTVGMTYRFVIPLVPGP